MSRGDVLVVDDDPGVGKVLGALLRQDGFSTEHALSGRAALEVLEHRHVDAVVTDQRMQEMDGVTLLQHIRSRWPDIPVVMLTAHGSIELAVEAMKAGAYDFVLKPFDRAEILFTLKKAIAISRHVGAKIESKHAGPATPMHEVSRLIDKAAAGRATVLILGESGTGKSLAARTIHEKSQRRDAPFVEVHCGALPDSLLSSELFGHEVGAFTGATVAKPGRVAIANNGTLFLDEIGDITPAFQIELLRLLQDRRYEPLGSSKVRTADVRFIAATHRDLVAMVKSGEFREDLFYRLNVIPIVMPPLRERRSEIAPLARRFCAEHAAANDRVGAALDPSAIEALENETWPGNVRHLQNFIERLVVLSDDPLIRGENVRRELERQGIMSAPPATTLDEKKKTAEREALVSALEKAGNNRSQAARILGVSRRTLYNKLHEHGLV